MDEEYQYYNYPLDEAEALFNKEIGSQFPNKEFLDFYLSKPKDLGFFPTNVSQNPAMVNYGIMGTDQAKMFRGDIDDKYVPMPEEDSGEESGIAKLLKFIMPGSFLENIVGEGSPEIRSMRNFYSDRYGLTPTGSLASGIMKGYNPVSGGFLNFITGGRLGKPTSYGLADAARRRIQNIATRKAPQTEASRRKIEELQKFAEADTISRARQKAPDVYRDAGKEGRLGPGGGFSTSGREGAFSSKSSRGRQDF